MGNQFNQTQGGMYISVAVVTLVSIMLVPVQPLPLPNPAPAPFEPITTLIAAKLFLGGVYVGAVLLQEDEAQPTRARPASTRGRLVTRGRQPVVTKGRPVPVRGKRAALLPFHYGFLSALRR